MEGLGASRGISRVLNSALPRQLGDVRAIHAVGEREQLPLALQLEAGLPSEELLHQLGVFLGFKAAGAVNQRAAGFQAGGSFLQQVELRGAKALEFGWLNAPAQV